MSHDREVGMILGLESTVYFIQDVLTMSAFYIVRLIHFSYTYCQPQSSIDIFKVNSTIQCEARMQTIALFYIHLQ
jgi:hypothetical protein